jgi:hypothetical protein
LFVQSGLQLPSHWLVTPLQVWSLVQLPHTPPHVSSPHCLPEQLGVQMLPSVPLEPAAPPSIGIPTVPPWPAPAEVLPVEQALMTRLKLININKAILCTFMPDRLLVLDEPKALRYQQIGRMLSPLDWQEQFEFIQAGRLGPRLPLR